MIFTIESLKERYKDYVDYKGKIRRDVKEGKLYRFKQGLYEDNPNLDGKYLCLAIYSPSYLSFEYALSRYGLIPERVYAYTSATFRKGKSKTYVSHFGRFTYRDVPEDVYTFGVNVIQENGYAYMIATPEKAICDKLYIMPPVTSVKKIKEMLFDDLRIDEELFFSLSFEDFLFLCPRYKSSNLNQLAKLIKEIKR